MHIQKTGFAKTVIAPLKRFFRARNIIIISEHKVDHVPLSGIMQVLLLVGTIGLFSGVSYITGSYMTARSSIREKERKIASTTFEKVRIGEQMDALKRDLIRLGQNGNEMSSYSKFIIDGHDGITADVDPKSLGAATPSPQVFAQDITGLQSHVNYLEERIRDIQDENDHLVRAIRERTDKKIDDFEEIISMTGLDADKLEHQAVKGEGKSDSEDETSEDAPSRAVPAFPGNEHAQKKDSPHTQNEGGPFIPLNSTALNEVERGLLVNVDRMLLLHDIVEQLPLSQPISGAQTTGPFGKRVDPLNGRWAIHPGVDLAGPAGSKIFCTSGGKVIAAGHHSAYGNAVDIDHGFGIVTRYAHMSKVLVEEGQIVKKGQQVGIQGSTGRSTGPHLHYEVRIEDRPVNPVKFLQAGEYVSEK